MKSNILLFVKYLLLLIAGGVGLFWLYDYCVNTEGISLYYSLNTLLIFHCGLSFFLFSIIFIVNKRRKQHTAFAFMAGFVFCSRSNSLTSAGKNCKSFTFIRNVLHLIALFLFHNHRGCISDSVDKISGSRMADRKLANEKMRELGNLEMRK